MHHFCHHEKGTRREAQQRLSELISEVENGEGIVITRRGKKVAKIEAYREEDAVEIKVDWTIAIRETRETLAHLPKFEDSIVEIMRRDERY